MITYRRGNIFDSDAYAFVNLVNCVGASGRGLALQFKKRFPENDALYRRHCLNNWMTPGKVFPVWRSDAEWSGSPCCILNFPTKNHWRNPSKLEWIESGMKDLAAFVEYTRIPSVVIPKLGCGHGGLLWKDVKPIIEEAAKRMKYVDVEVVTW